MMLEGRVENGAIVLDDPTPLPEGAKVRVEFVSSANEPEPKQGADSAYERIKLAVRQAKTKRPEPTSLTLTQCYADALGSAVDLPADMAERHDHYIHGSDR